MALSIADRGYVLVHGEIVLEGTGSALLKDRHLLAASYLGEEGLKEDTQRNTT
jgi:branched-chain amino acid transport system ATP-binding protein